MRLGDVDGEEDGGDEGAEHGARQEVGQVDQQRRRPELRRKTLPDPLSVGVTPSHQHLTRLNSDFQSIKNILFYW